MMARDAWGNSGGNRRRFSKILLQHFPQKFNKKAKINDKISLPKYVINSLMTDKNSQSLMRLMS